MKIGWALDMIGWACAQPFPTLAMPLAACRSCDVRCIDSNSHKAIYTVYMLATVDVMAKLQLVGYTAMVLIDVHLTGQVAS